AIGSLMVPGIEAVGLFNVVVTCTSILARRRQSFLSRQLRDLHRHFESHPMSDPTRQAPSVASATRTDRLPRFVIVGAGFGGLRAATSLRKADVQVVVIDRSNHHLFQPLLYQVATGSLSYAEIATPLRRIFRSQTNAEVILGDVTSVDVTGKRVILA